jgi:hypothetical protein
MCDEWFFAIVDTQIHLLALGVDWFFGSCGLANLRRDLHASGEHRFRPFQQLQLIVWNRISLYRCRESGRQQCCESELGGDAEYRQQWF